MADVENVGIDWTKPLDTIKNSNYKTVIFTRSDFGFIDPNNVQIPPTQMVFVVFETKGDNHVALYKNRENLWGMNGKGQIRTIAILVTNMQAFKQYGVNSLLNEDLTLNLSFENIEKIATFKDADELKKIYDNMQYETNLDSSIMGIHATVNIQLFYAFCNKEIFNPNFHPVKDFKEFIFGTTEDLWGGNGMSAKFYGKPYNVGFDWGGYAGPFKDNIPIDSQNVSLDLLKSASTLSSNQFYARKRRLVNLYGEDYTLDEYRRDFVTSYYNEDFLKSVINFGNALVYDDSQGSRNWFISGDNGFNVPDGTSLLWGYLNGVNILVLSSDDTEDNKVQADAYLADPDNYIPPDNAQITTLDKDGHPDTTTKDDKPNPEDSSKDKNDNKDKTTFPTTWDSTTGATLYEITHDELKQFINYFWGNGITSDASILPFLQGLYGNITQAVMGVTFFPLDLELPKSARSVKVGRLETSFTWNTVADNVVMFNMGSVKVTPQSSRLTFFDYAPYTEIKLYLPYLGIISLDTNSYMDTTLEVRLVVDVASGNATYILLSDGTIYDTYTVQIGISIPFTLSNGSEIQASLVRNAISCSLSAVTPIKGVTGVKALGTVAGMASSGLNAVTDINVPSFDNKGSVTGASSLGNCQNCILYMKRPIYNRPSSYGLVAGFPVNKTFKLSTLKGYTECINAKIETFKDKPTESEYNEIIELLEGGIII